jgi:hypothetical protein
MIKKSSEKIATHEKVYHIYAKERCLYHNLNVEDFEEKWEMLNIMVGILKTDYQTDDLQYVEVEETPTDKEENSY